MTLLRRLTTALGPSISILSLIVLSIILVAPLTNVLDNFECVIALTMAIIVRSPRITNGTSILVGFLLTRRRLLLTLNLVRNVPYRL